ncbi:MAG: hypothetical protein Q8P11_01210 [bacterium]|nr:hypothetical protein [bacterium]
MQKRRFAKSAAVTATVILGLAGSGAGVLYAATATGGASPGNALITAIAQRFNLNEDDVKQVFDEQRAQMHEQTQEQRQNILQNRLTKAVANGTITQAQADAISVKEQEINNQMDALKDKTPQERQSALKAQHQALKQWATDNNIPQKLFPFGGPRMGYGHQGFKGSSGHNEGEVPRELRPRPRVQ